MVCHSGSVTLSWQIQDGCPCDVTDSEGSGVSLVDSLDMQLMHALAVDGRAPFSSIAEVLDCSDRTIAYRYRKLRAAGLRVVGVLNGRRLGYIEWLIRISCAPDAALAVATALARRDDTFWVHLASGGTEIVCITRTRGAGDQLLLERLSRTPRIIGVAAQCMLRGVAGVGGWPGRLVALSPDQVARLRPVESPGGANEPEPVEFTDADWSLMQALGVDGRTAYPGLAAVTGCSASTVRRRLAQLRQDGVLYFDIDLDPTWFGYHCHAMLSLTVAPAELACVADTLARHVEIAYAAATTGTTNLVAFAVFHNLDALYDYLATSIGALQGVLRVESSLIGRQVKLAGAHVKT
ncbi:Lrp/AsnC family transcriptional regulator [Nocardia brasiliensis]|uniref:Lrp/AsnC family transcriptional regulator n=1 Tax=Nocardia brasiliensis TaxID=37326 RepID=UPI001894D00F|nr:AsnC family transcriptional regulator [Nocardia brasiliensis]MBF6544092.1 Lrp/AsnC family transcriptional regulator [Nocardia brasiliensis]